jgi:hypothetical protein
MTTKEKKGTVRIEGEISRRKFRDDLVGICVHVSSLKYRIKR